MKVNLIKNSLIILFCICFIITKGQKYEPEWTSLNSRPIPSWFTNAKFGIFIHWGVFSVPSYRQVSPRLYESYAEWYQAKVMYDGGEGEDFHKRNYGENFEYRDFASLFKAELFDPDFWADLFKKSGAKYVVLTSKHHDGYCLWKTKIRSKKDWNSFDIGPKRDLLGDLTNSVRKQGLKMGIYYSLMEWESTPRNHEWSGGLDGYYLPEKIINKYRIEDPEFVDENIIPQLKELVINYQPSIIFSDGEWDKTYEYWKSKEFISWLYNHAPNKNEVVVNDRWGVDTRGIHGGYFTSEYSSDKDRMTGNHPWEESRGMGQSYGYNRAENISDYVSSYDLIYQLVDIVSRGGNLLLNIGPTADGRIPVIMQQRLMDIGKWLSINGDAIYGTETFRRNNSKNGEMECFFTRKGNDLYLTIFGLNSDKISLEIAEINNPAKVQMLGLNKTIDYQFHDNILKINLSAEMILNSCLQNSIVFKLQNCIQ